MSPSTHPRRRGTGVAALAGAIALAVGSLIAGAAAAAPPAVDPATLQPALNPNFAPWDCFQAGRGITCKGGYTASYSEPFGLLCDGEEVWITGEAREQMTRWHTAEGLATRTIVHLDFPGDVFTLGPDGDGPELVISGHFNRHYTYPDPGDRSTRVLTERGMIYLGKTDRGVVLRDAGSVRYLPGQDFEAVDVAHGVHDVLEDPGVVDRAICEALT